MSRTLIITNDFPPRQGGIESFVFSIAQRLPADQVVVYTAAMPQAAQFDAGLAYPVIRDRRSMLLPTGRVARAVSEVAREYGCEAALYGASAPLGLLAGALGAAGVQRQVAITHGHEVWWASLPGARQLLRRIGERTDALTYLGEFTKSKIAPALTPAAQSRMAQFTPGIDTDQFHPHCGGAALRERLDISMNRPVVLCASRLVARKGQDVLVKSWLRVLAEVPEALLLLVGEGPMRPKLERMIRARHLTESVRLLGPLPWEQLPPYFDAVDVFAMPCRTRKAGLEPEALGIVFLEAAACGVPTVVGNSGGAPDTCREGETGFVVDGRDPQQVAARIVELLTTPELAARMGQAGLEWITHEWTWQRRIHQLQGLLDPTTTRER